MASPAKKSTTGATGVRSPTTSVTGGARRPPAAGAQPAGFGPSEEGERGGVSAPPARRGSGNMASAVLQKAKAPFAKRSTGGKGDGPIVIDNDARRQQIREHGRSASVGDDFVPEVEQEGADRYSVSADGTVSTQGDFLVGAKIKRQSSTESRGENAMLF